VASEEDQNLPRLSNSKASLEEQVADFEVASEAVSEEEIVEASEVAIEGDSEVAGEAIVVVFEEVLEAVSKIDHLSRMHLGKIGTRLDKIEVDSEVGSEAETETTTTEEEELLEIVLHLLVTVIQEQVLALALNLVDRQ